MIDKLKIYTSDDMRKNSITIKQQAKKEFIEKWKRLKEIHKCNEDTYYWGDIAMEFNEFIKKKLKEEN